MRRVLLISLLFVILPMLGGCGGGGEDPAPDPPGTYYVSPSGNDSADGTTPETAWETIENCVSHVAPGDTVVIGTGSYVEMVRLDGLPVGEDPITFRAQTPGGAVISGGHYCFGTDSDVATNLVFDGLKIDGGGMGFGFMCGINGLTIRNCEVTGTAEAIRVSNGRSLVIEDCRIHDNDNGIVIGLFEEPSVEGVRIERTIMTNNADPTGSGNRDGVVIEALCTDVVIRDCTASGSTDTGFDIKPDGTLIERCRSFGNDQWGIKLWGSDCVVVNCLMYDNDAGGIGLSGDGVQIWNCTFGPCVGVGLWAETEDPGTLMIRNSIFHNAMLQCRASGLPDEDYNCYYVDTGDPIISIAGESLSMEDVAGDSAGTGACTLAADPRFVNVMGRSFGLSADSPCRDAGLWSVLIALDLLRQPRTDPPDMGAIQG